MMSIFSLFFVPPSLYIFKSTFHFSAILLTSRKDIANPAQLQRQKHKSELTFKYISLFLAISLNINSASFGILQTNAAGINEMGIFLNLLTCFIPFFSAIIEAKVPYEKKSLVFKMVFLGISKTMLYFPTSLRAFTKSSATNDFFDK